MKSALQDENNIFCVKTSYSLYVLFIHIIFQQYVLQAQQIDLAHLNQTQDTRMKCGENSGFFLSDCFGENWSFQTPIFHDVVPLRITRGLYFSPKRKEARSEGLENSCCLIFSKFALVSVGYLYLKFILRVCGMSLK